MLNIKSYKNGKRAGISLEFVLAVSLAVLALFFILGLFSGNLKDMVAASNISRMFAKNDSKTATTKLALDPTSTQVNVQTVGTQGLQWYLDNAQAIIAQYKQNPPQNEAQVQDLAKQATIAKIGGVLSDQDMGDFYTAKYGYIYITIDPNRGVYNTTINNNNKKILNYNENGSILSQEDSYKLLAIREITNKNFVDK